VPQLDILSTTELGPILLEHPHPLATESCSPDSVILGWQSGEREFEGFRARPAPADRFATRGGVHLGNRFTADRPEAVSPSGDTLKGLGCCPGVVRARARVITDPRNAVIEPGEILVAPRTDPGWIMLFPSAAGLLVEHGSLLSHSAIVAREMGIPAIVSITGVTAWVQTGEWLEMDGSSGLVRKTESPAA
jgi:pyruvate,water dikinase